MTWPSNVGTRTFYIPPSQILESGADLIIRVVIKASRSLIRVSDGYRMQAYFVRTISDAGEQATFELPATDGSGWRDAETGEEILITGPSQYTHTYTACIQLLTSQNVLVGESYEIGPFVAPFYHVGILPIPDPGINLVTSLPFDSTEGEKVLVPPDWFGFLEDALPDRIQSDTDNTVLDDMDDVVESGWYRSKSDTLNVPRAGTLWYGSFIAGEDGLDGIQVAHGYDGAYKNLAFVRSKINGAWSSWASLGSAAGSYPLMEDPDDEGTYLITSP